MKERTEQGFEISMIERERWTTAILTALHEMRCASADSLSRHGYAEPRSPQDRPSFTPNPSSSAVSSNPAR